MSRSRLAWAVGLVAVWTLFGLLSASIVLTSHWAEGDALPVSFALMMEMTGAYTFLALLPAALAFMRRFPIGREDWWRRVPLHLAFSMVFGATHTLLMWGTRILAYRMLGWGSYDYGLMRYRFPMEYQKQLVSYALVYAAWATIGYVRRSREREVAAARLRAQLVEARLDALKMQLNPHFLFNTLHMISSFVHSDPGRADAMIGHLSDFLRETLRHSDRHEVPLGQELEMLDAYLEIMRARFEDHLRVSVDAPEESRRGLVPHLVLQPLVENAVAHGTAESTRAVHVRVAAARTGNRLRLVVEDDGPGMEGDPGQAVGRGIGLSNTIERLRTLYGPDHGVVLENLEQGGLRLSLEIPWRETAESADGPARAAAR